MLLVILPLSHILKLIVQRTEKETETSFVNVSSNSIWHPFPGLDSILSQERYKIFVTPIRFTLDFESVGLIPFASLRSSKILKQPFRFRFVFDKVRTTSRFVSSWRNWRLNQPVLASIFELVFSFFFRSHELFYWPNSFSLRYLDV